MFKINLHRSDYRLLTPKKQNISAALQIIDDKIKQYDITGTVTNFNSILESMEKPKRNYFDCLKFSLKHLKAINIDIKDLKNFPKEPFGRKNSLKFVNLCKNGKAEQVIEMLDADK